MTPSDKKIESIILVLRSLSTQEVELIKSLQVLSSKVYMSPKLITHINIQDFPIEKYQFSEKLIQQVNKDVLKRILKFGNLPFQGKKVVDFLNYENFNYWYLSKFRLNYEIRENYYYVADFLQKATTYKHIHIFTNQDFSSLEDFPSNIKFYYHSEQKLKNKKYYINLVTYFSQFFIRAIQGTFQKRNLKKSPHLVIDYPTDHSTFLSSKNLKPIKGNIYLNYLLEKQGSFFVKLQEFHNPKIDKKINYLTINFNKEGNLFNGEYITFSRIFFIGNWLKIKKVAEELLSNLDALEKFTTNKFDKQIIEFLQSKKNSLYFYLFRYFAYKSWFLKNKNIKTIVTTDENASFTRVILDAAKAAKIKTYGIQHGAITEDNPDYSFTKYDAKYYTPMPYKTFVWGSAWKETMKTIGNYSNESVEVVGQLRTDIIEKIRKRQTKNLDKKITLVFYSQPLEVNYKKKVLRILFSGFKPYDNHNFQLIIRLHPKETSLALFQKIAKEFDIANWKFSERIDLYLQINQIDLALTVHSTVGAEVIYFYKPLILIDLYKEDLINYVKDGVAVSTNSAKELIESIDLFRNNNFPVSKKQMQKYIKEKAFKIDGKVSERIIQTIKNS